MGNGKQLRRLAGTTALVVLLFATQALARAGGGGGFSSGHSSGGGGSGGGGGGSGLGGLVFDLIWLILVHPVIGVPLLIVVVVVCIYFYNQPGSASSVLQTGDTSNDRRPTGRVQAAPTETLVQRIQVHDPAFDPRAFASRVAAGFLKLQQAWCAQNLSTVRPFISDGIHERFSLQFAEQKANDYRDQMDGTAARDLTIVDSACDEIYDEISIQVTAYAADYRVSLTTGQPVNGRARGENFVEIWSFLRRRGAATITGKPGLMEGNCPNCGAPIELNESANCEHCKALLRSGEYDWVLSEITQISVWQPGGHHAVPGLEQLQQYDPDLNVQSLEDRASVVFWRKASADRLGKVDPMVKATSPEYLAAYKARLKSATDGTRTYFAECAVGSVHVMGFVGATQQQPKEQALVEVRWSGVRVLVQPDGQKKQMSDNDPHHTLLILQRNAGVKTDAGKGVSSAHCPNCGAPETGGNGGACEFCGTALNDGSSGWVLDDILSFADTKAQQLLSEIRTR